MIRSGLKISGCRCTFSLCHWTSRHRKLAGLIDVYRSPVWITLFLVRVGFVNMMWEGEQNLSVSVQGSWHPLSLNFKCENNNNKKASLHSFVYLSSFPSESIRYKYRNIFKGKQIFLAVNSHMTTCKLYLDYIRDSSQTIDRRFHCVMCHAWCVGRLYKIFEKFFSNLTEAKMQ